MDYEKKYKEALERARANYKADKEMGFLENCDMLELIFPELAESEDEWIRKLLVWQVHRNIEDETNDLAGSIYDGIKGHDPDLEESIEDWKKCLAWLEKQKENIEKEYVFRPLAGTDITIAAEQAIRRANEGDRLVLAFNGAYIPVRKGCNANKIVEIYDAFIEKQEEQKPKVKIIIPKFRVGDIIQRNPLEQWDKTKRIESIDEYGYNFDYKHLGKSGGGCIGFSFEEEYELTEPKPVEWSEEDDMMRDNIISVLSAFVGTVECESNPSLSSSYPTYRREIDWLKSLRLSWKPSEELIGCLERLIAFKNPEPEDIKGCESLIEQLRKL